MRTITSFIVCLVLITSCQDETLNTMEDINDQWSEKNTESREAGQVIDEIMKKYNAQSYEITRLDKSDPSRTNFTLRDYHKKAIDGISPTDRARMSEAIVALNNIEREMALLKDVDEVFTVVEQQPVPQGGMESFFKHIAETMSYPESARKMGIQGKVFVKFVVNEYGEITQVEAVKGIGGGCDEAAVEAVKNSEPWLPGKQKGEAVKVRMVVPVNFKLDDA